ncbi:hypothetical protein Pmar_PMAR026344, partial [Perkinsus marinus ATCC 50983]
MTIGQVPLIRDFFSLFERDALVELEKDFYTNSKANAEIMQSQNNNEFPMTGKKRPEPVGLTVVQFLYLCLSHLDLDTFDRRAEAGSALPELMELIVSFFRKCDREATGFISWTDFVGRYRSILLEKADGVGSGVRSVTAAMNTELIDVFRHG